MTDPGHDRFLAALVNECDCCDMCNPGPCAGLTAGGFCDSLCTCEPDDEDDDGRDDWDG